MNVIECKHPLRVSWKSNGFVFYCSLECVQTRLLAEIQISLSQMHKYPKYFFNYKRCDSVASMLNNIKNGFHVVMSWCKSCKSCRCSITGCNFYSVFLWSLSFVSCLCGWFCAWSLLPELNSFDLILFGFGGYSNHAEQGLRKIWERTWEICYQSTLLQTVERGLLSILRLWTFGFSLVELSQTWLFASEFKFFLLFFIHFFIQKNLPVQTHTHTHTHTHIVQNI